MLKGGNMFKIKTVLQQLVEEKNNNKLLNEKVQKLSSDMDYIAMMCEVKLEEDEVE